MCSSSFPQLAIATLGSIICIDLGPARRPLHDPFVSVSVSFAVSVSVSDVGHIMWPFRLKVRIRLRRPLWARWCTDHPMVSVPLRFGPRRPCGHHPMVSVPLRFGPRRPCGPIGTARPRAAFLRQRPGRRRTASRATSWPTSASSCLTPARPLGPAPIAGLPHPAPRESEQTGPHPDSLGNAPSCQVTSTVSLEAVPRLPCR